MEDAVLEPDPAKLKRRRYGWGEATGQAPRRAML